MANLKVDGLQQINTTSDSTPVSQEKENGQLKYLSGIILHCFAELVLATVLKTGVRVSFYFYFESKDLPKEGF